MPDSEWEKASRRKSGEQPDFLFEVGNFSLVIRRRPDGVALFDTRLAPLIFADQFIQLTTALPGNKVFGLGEHRTGKALGKPFSMLNIRDGFYILQSANYKTQSYLYHR